MSCTEVAVIGAGPYGLSLAAHLKGAGIPFRIVGRPMETWRDQMPKGMLLKSDGFASNLSDPAGEFPLERFCRERSVAYQHTDVPVELETFANYGVAFQRRLLPELDETKLSLLERKPGGYRLELATGESFTARKVVVATGISYYAHTPEALGSLPAELLAHSGSAAQHSDTYRGRSVAIIGGGASALDLAALLHEAGATVEVFARRPAVRFHNPPSGKPRSLLARLRAPASGLGPGWRSRLLTDLPGLFRLLPVEQRLRIVKRFLGPSAGWPMRERLEGKVTITTSVTPLAAEAQQGRARLAFRHANGTVVERITDQVIAATGYQVDLRRLPFLPAEVREQIHSVNHAPLLSSAFESSVQGLFFIGISSAASFGPMMRFAFGADYTARRMTRHLSRASRPALALEPAVLPAN